MKKYTTVPHGMISIKYKSDKEAFLIN
jgi:hypothetical protein